MGRRAVAALLIVLMVILHAQLWLGRGSLPEVNRMRERLAAQKAANLAAQRENERLQAEVKDLQEGLEMVEEKARMELGMVKPNEVLVQVGK